MAKWIISMAVSGAVTGTLAWATPVLATEQGGGAYPNGAEALAIAYVPPPGQYLINYTNYYTANRLNDPKGRSSIPGFGIEAYANVARFINVSDKTLFGASWAQQVFVPLVDLTVHAAGQRDSRFGLGDIIVDPFILAWHKPLDHFVVAIDTYLPTGNYDKRHLANIGRNYVTFEPVFAYTHINPKGGFEANLKIMYDFNTKNNATDYRSGQEFHTDFGASYNFNPVTVGVNGYYYRQTTDDKLNGVKVGADGFRGEALALGPVVRYQIGKVPLSFQYQHEILAHNRPQGNKFWLKASFKF